MVSLLDVFSINNDVIVKFINQLTMLPCSIHSTEPVNINYITIVLK